MTRAGEFWYNIIALGTIGNLVWLDEDADGVYEPGDGESGIENVSVNLIKDTNNNGKWDVGERIIATMATAGDGSYLFTGLELDDGDGDADYLVNVGDVYDTLRRYRKSTGTTGADNNSQADPYAVALSTGSPSNLTADFGYYFDAYQGLVGDRVWNDLDGDGIQDAGEPGVEGVEVKLYYQQAAMKNTGAAEHYVELDSRSL